MRTKTPLQVHTETWSACTKCHYSERRNRVVIGKGRCPCDVLFVGEAPGDSEDTSGVPFDGQAGFMLTEIVKRSGADKYRIAYNNVIGCVPKVRDAATGRYEKEDPDYDCVMACKPKLEEFIQIVGPKLIVTVGKIATEYLDQHDRDVVRAPGIRQVGIQHPAAILRSPYLARNLLVQKAVATVRRGVLDVFGE